MIREKTRSTDAYLVNPDGHRLHYVESGHRVGKCLVAQKHVQFGNLSGD